MKKMFLPLLAATVLFSCKDDKKSEEKASDTLVKSTTAETMKTPPMEIADEQLISKGEAMMRSFEAGDYDAWGQSLADNAVYEYSSGDSIAGKAAIIAYWKSRRAKFIKSTVFEHNIWLPVKVNESRNTGPDIRGTWLMHWMRLKTTYKNDRSVQMWVHQDMHLNDRDLVDRVILYMDRAPILEATKDIK